MSLLCLGKSNRLERHELAQVPTPPATRTWQPLAHEQFVDMVRHEVTATGLEIAGEDYGIFRDGGELFGLLSVTGASETGDFRTAIGLRNSHRKAFAAGLVLGAHVLVCDNLSFSGQVKVTRRHTHGIFDELPDRIRAGLAAVAPVTEFQKHRFRRYQEHRLRDTEFHDLLIESLDRKIISWGKAEAVLDEYRNPTHQEFEERTAWAAHNAYTEVMKQYIPTWRAGATSRLNGLFDELAGVEMPAFEGILLEPGIQN